MFKRVIVLLTGLALSGCSSNSGDNQPSSIEVYPESIASAVVANYVQIVYANYVATQERNQKLTSTIATLVQQPTSTHLEAARQAWLEARDIYGQSEAFRFGGGPIDDDKGPEGRINAWPIDEDFIDYVIGENSERRDVGIVNDIANFPNIDKNSIISSQ